MTRALRISFLLIPAISITYFFAQSKTRAQIRGKSTANFEAAQTNPIRISADGTRLFAVNTDNGSLSVFDITSSSSGPKLLAEIPVGLGPVSVNARTSDEVWVVNQVSNSVSVVSLSKGIVTDTIRVKTEPMDVVFAGTNQAFVSASRSSAIVVIDTSSHAITATIPVLGGSPRALAVSPDGSTVYAAFAISGNATTLIGPALAPPQSPPTNPALPNPPQVGLIVSATDPNWKSFIPYKMPDNDVVGIKVGASPRVLGYYSGVGTINLGLGVNPKTGDLYVANTDALNLTFFEPNLRGHFVNNRITEIQLSNSKITPYDLNPGIDYGVLPNPQAVSTALAQPTNVVFDPGGSFMYVAAFGTDRVARVGTGGNVIGFTEVSQPSGSGSNVDPEHKRGPRGLALNPTQGILYVLNRISNSISLINTSNYAVTSEIPVGTNAAQQAVQTGRGYLYDAKLSGNGTAACAACHVDGDMDHLAWNLGDPGGNMSYVVENGQLIAFHPMKGPMTTQTLRGLLNLSPYHWRGDKANFAAFNQSFDDLLGGNQLSSSDMDEYTNFINTILFLPNPNENLDRTYPTSFQGGNAVSGENVFLTVAETSAAGNPTLATCNSCHTANPGPGSNRNILALPTQPMKVPELRNLYQKMLFTRTGTTVDGFGLVHDGSVALFSGFIAGSDFAGYSATQKNDLAAFALCFDTGTAPAVGYTRTMTSSNVQTSSIQNDWSTLQAQAGSGNIDLIAAGTVQGKVSQLAYQPSAGNYITSTGVTYTQSQLVTFVLGGDTLSIMGIYPGTSGTQP